MATMRSPVFLLVLFSALLIISSAAGEGGTRGSRKSRMKLKITKFTVYWHDVVSGRHPTSVMVVPAAASNTSSLSSAAGFGMTRMIDNALTAGPDANSTLLGRAQGFYAAASQSAQPTLLMAMNFAFVTGKYNGSTLTLMGTNSVFSKVRELPVVGGTGLFRFVQGYAQLTTNMFDMKTGDAIVKYSMVVLHY